MSWLARFSTWLVRSSLWLTTIPVALLAAALAVGTAGSFAADTSGTSSGSANEGLMARAKQVFTGGRSQAPVGDSLDRQNPSKTTFGIIRPKTHWWTPKSNKPIRRTALDFWSQDSTAR